MAQQTKSTDSPGLAQLIEEIAWFHACIREAGREGREAVREARAAYAPFLLRRLKLLAALRDGAADAWRDYRPACGHGARPREAGRASPCRSPHRARGPWWRTPS